MSDWSHGAHELGGWHRGWARGWLHSVADCCRWLPLLHASASMRCWLGTGVVQQAGCCGVRMLLLTPRPPAPPTQVLPVPARPLEAQRAATQGGAGGLEAGHWCAWVAAAADMGRRADVRLAWPRTAALTWPKKARAGRLEAGWAYNRCSRLSLPAVAAEFSLESGNKDAPTLSCFRARKRSWPF